MSPDAESERRVAGSPPGGSCKNKEKNRSSNVRRCRNGHGSAGHGCGRIQAVSEEKWGNELAEQIIPG
jgi:hypothetical protein